MNKNEIKMKLLDEARATEDEMRLWWRAYYAMRFEAVSIAIATLENIELSYGLTKAWRTILEELKRKEQE